MYLFGWGMTMAYVVKGWKDESRVETSRFLYYIWWSVLGLYVGGMWPVYWLIYIVSGIGGKADGINGTPKNRNRVSK